MYIFIAQRDYKSTSNICAQNFVISKESSALQKFPYISLEITKILT